MVDNRTLHRFIIRWTERAPNRLRLVNTSSAVSLRDGLGLPQNVIRAAALRLAYQPAVCR